MDLNWDTFVIWAALMAISCLFYLFSCSGFKDYYYDKKANKGYAYTNFYYRLKHRKLLYLFFMDSFETMHEEILPPNEYEWRLQHYNPAMAVWVDDCICVDSTNISALSGKDILPQDMPDVNMSNHSLQLW